MNDLTVRRSRPGEDEEAFLALHNRNFVAQWDRAWWDWRYRDLPRGEATILGTYDEAGRCLAMYAGVRLSLWLEGETCSVLSQSDVAVDAQLRGGPGLTKLVTRMAKRFFAEYGGGTTKLTYGFPVPPLRRVILRYLGGQVLTDVVFLVDDFKHGIAPCPTAIETRLVPRFSARTDDLWSACRSEFKAAIVRDSAYLNWRYADHPGVEYTLVEAREVTTGTLRGVLVLREDGWSPQTACISDWLVPTGDEEVELALLHRAREFAASRDKGALLAWFPSASAHFHRFQVNHGFFARATPYQELFTSWQPGIDRDWLQEHWYQSMGDIDFF